MGNGWCRVNYLFKQSLFGLLWPYSTRPWLCPIAKHVQQEEIVYAKKTNADADLDKTARCVSNVSNTTAPNRQLAWVSYVFGVGSGSTLCGSGTQMHCLTVF